jgi:hypothetical protein
MSQAINRDTTKLSRRTALAGLAGAAAGGITPAIGAEPDPIFALIAEHCAAVDAHCRAVHIQGEMVDHGPDKDPRYDAAKAIAIEAASAMYDAHWDVLTVQPTTLRGVAALLAHVGQDEWLKNQPDYPDQKETFLSTFIHDDDSDFKRASQDLPLRLAETVRSLIGGQS